MSTPAKTVIKKQQLRIKWSGIQREITTFDIIAENDHEFIISENNVFKGIRKAGVGIGYQTTFSPRRLDELGSKIDFFAEGDRVILMTRYTLDTKTEPLYKLASNELQRFPEFRHLAINDKGKLVSI